MENYGESKVITALKGLLGAIIGAVPGMLIWIILGKIGFVFSAVGILIGLGIIMGFAFFTKNADVPLWIMFVIFFGVFAVAMILSEKIVWTWELASTFKEYLPVFREDIIAGAIAEDSTLTRTEVENILTDELFTEIIEENFGIKEGTFGECFSNFSTLLENLDMKGKYIASLAKSSLFGIIGGIGIFAKMGK
ncbi:MAG: hypothetical protein K2J47_01005 [Ruminococcus sp.]|nr:hypothetical protein [Ruminococcus sp.]